MLSTPIVDFQGSGTLQYLRAEWAERRELYGVRSEWPRQPTAANAFLLPGKIEFTVPSRLSETGFNARRNLIAVRDLLRSGSASLSTDDLLIAEAALRRLESRSNEDTSLWANNLSADLSSHHD